ncbi:MAG: DNA-processing protein DprA [Planctomycetota bacterium]
MPRLAADPRHLFDSPRELLLALRMSGAAPDEAIRVAAADPERVLGSHIWLPGPITTTDPRERQLRSAIEHTVGDDAMLRLVTQRKHMDALGVRLWTLADWEELPILLRAGSHGAGMWWVWGDVAPEDRFAVAVAGSSRCTSYGKRQARRFGAAAAAHGLTVITGGERGVDHEATDAALEAGGRVIVVLGAGIEAHGRPHHEQYEQIVKQGRGAVISTSPLDAPPDPVNQVAGDFLVASLAIAVVVIEATAGSGAMIASRIFRDELERPVMAVPGPIDSPQSEGVNSMIGAGNAELVSSTDEMLDRLVGHARELDYRVSSGRVNARDFVRNGPLPRNLFRPKIDAVERSVLEAMDRSRDLAGLSEASGVDIADVRKLMYRLYLAGVVDRRWS